MSGKNSLLQYNTAVRTDLAASLRARSRTEISRELGTIPAASPFPSRQAWDTRAASLESRLRGAAERGIGVLIRTGMINASLQNNGIDTCRADELIMKGKTQIITVRNLSNDGTIIGARASLSKFKKTLLALRDIQDTLRAISEVYRRILDEENLPKPTAQGVLSVVQALDIAATQMGTF